jgi:hypothetical protein
MPAQELPARPNLDQYKKRAKELVKAAKAGEARAFALMREHHPRLKKASDDELRRAKFALADAQLIIAHWHGFASWPKFAKHIDTISSESSTRIWTRAEKALVDGDVATLDAMLARHGDMLRKGPVQSSWWGGLAPNYAKGDARAIIAREHDFESWDQFAAFAEAMKDTRSPIAQFEAAVDVIIGGDIATLERLLRANPPVVRARSTRKHHSTLLHYVASNGVEGFRQRTPKNIGRRTAATRIPSACCSHHAPVNVKDETFEGTPLGWALYAWAGGGPHAGDSRYYDVVKLLVAAGAMVAEEWLNEDERGVPIAKNIRRDTAMRAALGGKLG